MARRSRKSRTRGKKRGGQEDSDVDMRRASSESMDIDWSSNASSISRRTSNVSIRNTKCGNFFDVLPKSGVSTQEIEASIELVDCHQIAGEGEGAIYKYSVSIDQNQIDQIRFNPFHFAHIYEERTKQLYLLRGSPYGTIHKVTSMRVQPEFKKIELIMLTEHHVGEADEDIPEYMKIQTW